MASGQDIRITDVPFNSVPDHTSTVFINDNGKLRQTDLTTIAKYSQLYELIIEAHNNGLQSLEETKAQLEQALVNLANEKFDWINTDHTENLAELTTLFENSMTRINATVESGHNKLLEDISTVDDLRKYAATIREVNFSSNADAEITTELGYMLVKSIKGYSYQAGVPTSDNPQDIISVGDRGKISIDVYDTDYKDREGISINLKKPLRGIGNVKDEICIQDGQYGVLRRIGIIEEYVSEVITTEYMSTTGGLDNHATIIYVLPTPVFEPFDNQAQFFGLRAFEKTVCIRIGCSDDNAVIDVTVQYPSTEAGAILTNTYVSLYGLYTGFMQFGDNLDVILNEMNNKLTINRATLTAGSTSITIANPNINQDSILTFYTSIYNVSPSNVVVENGNVTLSFDAQESDMEVGVQING